MSEICFNGSSQTQDQIQALHYILIGLGLIEATIPPPAPDDNVFVLEAYAELLEAEILQQHDDPIQGLLVKAPGKDLWIHLGDYPEDFDCIPQLALRFLDEKEAEDLRDKFTIIFDPSASSNDRW